MITYSDSNIFTPAELERLFLSVDWYSGRFPEKLAAAFRNSSYVVSAWENGTLVGIMRALSDGVWQATIDCLLVDRDHQRRGIGSELVRRMKERLGGLLYIAVAPEEAKNCSFYEKHGFQIVENGATMILKSDWQT